MTNAAVQTGILTSLRWKSGDFAASQQRTGFGRIPRFPSGARTYRVDFINCCVLFLLNVWLIRELFGIEYLNHFSSIEGAFISIARYLKDHWGDVAWWPLWNSGMPFEYVYVPLVHTVVAGVAAGAGWTAARAYHFVTGVGYCLGPVALYVLARTLAAGPMAAMTAGLLYSVFSPSLLFMADVRADSGALFAGRRLRVMTVFGEGPHVVGMTMATLALAGLYRCLVGLKPETTKHGTTKSWAWAAIGLALVIMTNTPATLMLLVALLCLFFSLPEIAFGRLVWRAGVVAIQGYAIACWAVPPSYIKMVFRNLGSTHAGFAAGGWRWGLLLGLLMLLYGLGRSLKHLPLYLRFGLLYCIFLLSVSPGADSGRFELLPEAGRFHLELELAICLVVAGVFCQIYDQMSRSKRLVAMGIGIAFLCVLTSSFLTRVKFDLVSSELESRSEFQSTRWLAGHRTEWQGRVFAPGSNSFWLNVFSDLPQVTGCCDQGRSSDMPARLASVVNLAETPEQRRRAILWLKAFGVGAVIAPGPKSTEEYKDFREWEKFKGMLPVLHESAGDIIYQVPNVAPDLVQVLDAHQQLEMPHDSPEFYLELERYVGGAGGVAPKVIWRNSHAANIEATLKAGQVVNVRISSVPGWRASVGGKRVPIVRDALDFMTIKPDCNGACEIKLEWSSPVPGWITGLVSAGAILLCLLKILG